VLTPDATAAAHDPLKPARDAAYRKLGRNVALFQQLESLLKAFYGSLVLEGSDAESAAAMAAKRREVLATRTLGKVAKAVFDELMDEAEDDGPALGIGQGLIRLRLRTTGPEVETRQRALDDLVAERNRLIHHLTDDFDLRSADGIAQFDHMLDPQADRILEEFRAWQALAEEHRQMRREVAEFLASHVFRDAMELGFLRSSPLITGLSALARSCARPDGWTELGHACAQLAQSDPGAIRNLKARYGHDRVKPLLIACGLFQVREEATPGGGWRVAYRALPSVDAAS
jgi:hypothetical protein